MKLRELDVSREQWEEFQRLTLSAGGGPSELEKDEPAAVTARLRVMLDHSVLSVCTAIVSCVEKFNERVLSADAVASGGSSG